MTEKNKQQLLRDPNIEPNSEVIAKGLGEATYKTYKKFVDELAKNHNVTLMDWRFYNDGKAWLTKGEYHWTTARGTNKVKPMKMSISVDRNHSRHYAGAS